MIRVLLADDEEIIRQGIQALIPFEELGFELCCSSENGKQALNYIVNNPVDIVITDIKMPIMDGIALIEATKELPKAPRFILLTGYSDFEYAKTAMKYGVQHYLLKPCDETVIIQAMKEIQIDLLKSASQKKQLGRILSKAFKGFLNSFLLHGGCLESDFNYYSQCLNPGNNPVLCLLLQPEISDSALLNFAIENISEELLSDFSVIGNITINNHFLLILTAHDIIRLKEAIQNIKKYFRSFYQCGLSASLSSEGSFHDIPKLYHEVLGNSMYHYYVSAEIIITPNTVKKFTTHKNPEITTDMKNIQDAILQFDEDSAVQALHQIFSLLYATTITIPNLRKEVLNLYFMIVQQQRDNLNPIDTAVVSRLMSQDSLHTSYDLLCKCIHNTIEENKQKLVMPKEDIIAKIQCLVDLHLSENTLTLKWIAQQIYMSENYLSKFFYKATGQKFTQYLTTKRINRAKQMIQSNPYVKLTTLCKSLGFENNPAYFSTLFKNVTGQTLTEYKQQYLPKETTSCILK